MSIIQGVLQGVNPGVGSAALPTSALTWMQHPTLSALPVPTSLYTCQDASGGLADAIGGLNLSESGSPTYQQTGLNGRYAVGCTGSDLFVAGANTVWDLDGSTSLTMLALVHHGATTATERGVFGKKAGAADSAAGYSVNFRVSGKQHRARVADGTNGVSSNELTNQDLSWSTPGLVVDRSGDNLIMFNEDGNDTDSISSVTGSESNTEVFALGGGAGAVPQNLLFAYFLVWFDTPLSTAQLDIGSAALLAGT